MSKRVVLITGCSQPDSLGVALAVDLQRRGSYEVYASARNIDSAGLQAARSEGCKVRRDIDRRIFGLSPGARP